MAPTKEKPTSLELDAEKQSVIHAETSPSIANIPTEDPVEVKRILRKIDWRLIPLTNLLYCLTFLDRVNIGNARLWNLERDLGMTGNQYNIAVLVFYVPVILFEMPSNMMLSHIQPRYWISGLVFGFGFSVTMAGFCKNFAGLIATRVLVGAFEAGMLPGCLYLLSSWYKRHELLSRMALFMLATDIAGTLSGFLGAGLGSLDGTGGYSGWSWIFFIEGGFSCVAAILGFLYLLPFPEDSTFLTPEEKAWVIQRLREDTKGGPLDKKKGWKDSFRALLDWKVWAAASLYLAVCVTGYAIAVFQPTILATFGWDGIKGNLLTAPVRVAAGISSVVIGYWSDKAKRRGIFCVVGFSISIVGSGLVMGINNNAVRYFGLYVTAVGIYMCQPLVLVWGYAAPCLNPFITYTSNEHMLTTPE